jgi:hypothetical protein
MVSSLIKDRQTYQDSPKNGEDGRDDGDDENGFSYIVLTIFFLSSICSQV